MKNKVVSATAAMTAHSAVGKEPRSIRIERAMIAAIDACAKKGITDPEKVHKAMLEARDAIAE